MTSVAQDLRYALRSLARSPGFSAVAIATLALGIGANTAIFSVLDAVLLKPLPYRDPDRVLAIWGSLRRPGSEKIEVSAPELADLRARTRAFESIAAYVEDDLNLTGGGEAERLSGAYVSPEIFSLLGVAPESGHWLRPGDDRVAGPRVVVISHALWQRRFAGDPGIISRAVMLDLAPVTVLGVMPPGFRLPGSDSQLWMPLVIAPERATEAYRDDRYLTVVARSRPDVTLAAARTDAAAAAAGIALDHAASYPGGYSAGVTPWHDEISGDSRPSLVVLAGAVALVLLIACANVASLQLARVATLRRELAVRAALGASRARLFAHSLAESAVLAAAGGTAGLALALAWTRTLVALAPPDIPGLSDVHADARLFAFTGVVTILTAALFGLLPAAQAGRAPGNAMRRETFSGTFAGRSAGPRQALVAAQCALALVLMVGAGLLLRSFQRLREVGPGFRVDHALSFGVLLQPSRYPDYAHQEAYFEEALSRLAALPGARSAGGISPLPLSGSGAGLNRSFRIEGRPQDPAHVAAEPVRFVSPGYFRTMGVPLRSGRFFTDRDDAASPRVVVINEALQKRYFPDGTAIGSRISFRRHDDEPDWHEVVGVVADVHQVGLDASETPAFYLPLSQPIFAGTTRLVSLSLVVETDADPARLLPAVRAVMASLDPTQPISDVRTMSERLAASVAPRRFSMLLVSVFAWVALCLAVVGIFGLVAHLVSERTRELALRVALGASPWQAAGLVVRQAALLIGAGILIGAGATLALARSIQGLLFGVGPADPLTFAGVAIVFTLIGLVASYLPARRAAHAEPAAVLRSD